MVQAVVVVCGLPGSGKTTLARTLYSRGIINTVIGLDELMESFSPERWKSARKSLLVALRETLSKAADSVILLDDVHEYRSMRYRVFKIAQAAGFAFGVIHCHVDPETCRARNLERSVSVPDSVWSRLQSRFEPPDSLRFLWEINFYCLSCEAEEIPRIKSFIEHLQVVPLALTLSEEKAAAESLVHKLDLKTRQVLKKVVSDLCLHCKRLYSSTLVIARRKAFEEFKAVLIVSDWMKRLDEELILNCCEDIFKTALSSTMLEEFGNEEIADKLMTALTKI